MRGYVSVADSALRIVRLLRRTALGLTLSECTRGKHKRDSEDPGECLHGSTADDERSQCRNRTPHESVSGARHVRDCANRLLRWPKFLPFMKL